MCCCLAAHEVIIYFIYIYSAKLNIFKIILILVKNMNSYVYDSEENAQDLLDYHNDFIHCFDENIVNLICR